MFFFGAINKNEHQLGTGIFEDGKETESVDVMHYIWNKAGHKIEHRKLKNFTLNRKTLMTMLYLNQGKQYWHP